MESDKRNFILGMITAFCECVAGGCKPLALSPPLTREEYEEIEEEACDLIGKHGLLHAREENADLPEDRRFWWILIAGKAQTLEKYRVLREQGLSPARSLEPFFDLLGYRPEERIEAGYDAYREKWGNCPVGMI